MHETIIKTLEINKGQLTLLKKYTFIYARNISKSYLDTCKICCIYMSHAFVYVNI